MAITNPRMQAPFKLYRRLSALCLLLATCAASVRRHSKPFAATQPQAEAQPRPPVSVILISVDTLRADRLSCYGYRLMRTPHIDQL